jgi:hypothetical protein
MGSTVSHGKKIRECLLQKALEDIGYGLFYDTVPLFSWNDWRKSRKSSAHIAGIRAENGTRDLQNKKQEVLTAQRRRSVTSHEIVNLGSTAH